MGLASRTMSGCITGTINCNELIGVGSEQGLDLNRGRKLPVHPA